MNGIDRSTRGMTGEGKRDPTISARHRIYIPWEVGWKPPSEIEGNAKRHRCLSLTRTPQV